MEALIWTQSNNDLEEHAGKDVRQEVLLSAFSACGSFFGAWEITHGKSPMPPSNPPSRRKEDACSRQFFVGQREIRGMHASMGTASSCLGFQSGVRDFRWEPGAWNMVVGFTTKLQLVRFVAFMDNNNTKIIRSRSLAIIIVMSMLISIFCIGCIETRTTYNYNGAIIDIVYGQNNNSILFNNSTINTTINTFKSNDIPSSSYTNRTIEYTVNNNSFYIYGIIKFYNQNITLKGTLQRNNSISIIVDDDLSKTKSKTDNEYRTDKNRVNDLVVNISNILMAEYNVTIINQTYIRNDRILTP